MFGRVDLDIERVVMIKWVLGIKFGRILVELFIGYMIIGKLFSLCRF